MHNQTHDISLELIQSTLDESFVDASDRLHTLISIKVKEQIDQLRESVAESMYKKKV